MEDSRKASSSGSRSFRKRSKKKPVVVELSDSSSESNEDDLPKALPLPTTTDKPNLKSTGTATLTTKLESIMECPVCLQHCIHPARLPCGHIFCFLCLKGIAQQSRRCAMCRQEISPDYLDRPDLVQTSEETQADKEAETFEGGYQWFYEGRNGWWQYDERTSRELETSYKTGIRTCELLIAGFLYTADFDAMVQSRRNEPHRRRRIKRDLASIPKKGVAGIRSDVNVNVDSVSEQLSSLTLDDNSTDQE